MTGPTGFARLDKSARQVNVREHVVGLWAPEASNVHAVCYDVDQPLALNVAALVADDDLAQLDAPFGRQRVVEEVAVLHQHVVDLVANLLFGVDAQSVVGQQRLYNMNVRRMLVVVWVEARPCVWVWGGAGGIRLCLAAESTAGLLRLVGRRGVGVAGRAADSTLGEQ